MKPDLEREVGQAWVWHRCKLQVGAFDERTWRGLRGIPVAESWRKLRSLTAVFPVAIEDEAKSG